MVVVFVIIALWALTLSHADMQTPRWIELLHKASQSLETQTHTHTEKLQAGFYFVGLRQVP